MSKEQRRAIGAAIDALIDLLDAYDGDQDAEDGDHSEEHDGRERDGDTAWLTGAA